MRVTYAKSVHGQKEIDAVVNVLKTSTQMGKQVAQFEQKVSQLFSKNYGLMVNSGSSALILAVEILNLPKSSEVITPALTFSTTVAPIVRNGLIPVFVDVKSGTYNIDEMQIESYITDKTSAIIVPNLIGNLPDWDIIRSLADKYNLKVIEDCADTLGPTLRGIPCGSRSDISITSFYGSHIINCAGNGGMLCLNDRQLFDRAKVLRSWGRSSSLFDPQNSEKIENRFDIVLDGLEYDKKFVFSELGYNFEPSELGAAFGLVQLASLDDNIASRRKYFKQHLDFFKNYESFFILPQELNDAHTGWLAFPLTVKSSAPFSRRDMQIFLEKNDIQTRPVFTGNILRQPGFENINCIRSDRGYPIADEVMRGGILIACHHGLDDQQVSYMHEQVKAFFENY
ncbi:DegT/DnrJ/EryC1/StrS family aminotransferase [Thiotrichales bacterium 19S11-10]|nr:DegT/DnrJ/EryC1/StrS family aminotransferase [Thiotrichales bacterium 19S11-10]